MPKTTGVTLKASFGLEKYPNVKICRVLVSTYRIYTIFYDSRMPSKPITQNELKRMQHFLPAMKYPFDSKAKLLPSMYIEEYNGTLANAMFFVVDLAGRFQNDSKKTKTFEDAPLFRGNLQEFVTFSDLNKTTNISPVTARARQQRNSNQGTENRLARVVDVQIDTVEDHVTFIFKTTATTSIYAPDAKFGKVNPDTKELERNNDKSYEIYIRVLNFMKWLKDTKPDNEEINVDDIKDVLDVNDVQVFSSSPSFHYQGFNYWLSQLDGSIYPTDIAPQRWNHTHGDGEAFLDKHLYGVIRQIKFYRNQMASMLTRRLKDRDLL